MKTNLCCWLVGLDIFQLVVDQVLMLNFDRWFRPVYDRLVLELGSVMSDEALYLIWSGSFYLWAIISNLGQIITSAKGLV